MSHLSEMSGIRYNQEGEIRDEYDLTYGLAQDIGLVQVHYHEPDLYGRLEWARVCGRSLALETSSPITTPAPPFPRSRKRRAAL